MHVSVERHRPLLAYDCIDLEYKSYANNKSRELRLIKLRFSRLLLYVSGILAVGEGYNLSHEQKRASLRELLRRYPVDRLEYIVGESASQILDLYAEFLEALDTRHIRESLEKEGPESEIFVDMSKRAKRFKRVFYNLLQEHFTDDNPTIRGLLL